MLKHEYLACLELHRRIKEEIIGDVFTTINNDTLVIRILAERGIRYSYEYKNISFEMICGQLNYDKIIGIFLREYKDYMMKRFFRR